MSIKVQHVVMSTTTLSGAYAGHNVKYIYLLRLIKSIQNPTIIEVFHIVCLHAPKLYLINYYDDSLIIT